MNQDATRARAALFLFFLSGAVGLIYQVVWVRLFIHVFGATVLAVSTVLAAFMGGLALGGLWGGRIVGRVKNPLRMYGLLELGLVLYAGFVPLILHALDPAYEALYPSLSGSFWALSGVRFAASLLVLLPPTFLMGATLPALTAHAERLRLRTRQRVAHLYAINTFGAVIGTAGASFVLLPTFGLSRTLLFGVGLNLVVAAAALLLARGQTTTPPRDTDDDTDPRDGRTLPRPFILVTAGVLGFSALAFEILWTRTLALALGTTTYAFAIVLTVFLFGIAGGSAFAGRLLRGPLDRAQAFFIASPAAIGLFALVVLPLFDRLPALFVKLSTIGGGTWLEGLAVRFFLAGLPMLVPTFLSGAAFPLAVGIDRRSAGTSRSVGDVYASNTLGAILGSWAAGFILIPMIGLRAGILFAAALQITATCVLLLRGGGRARLGALALAALTVAVVLLSPEWNHSALTRGGFAIAIDMRRYGQTELAEDKRELVFLEEGITSTITVRKWGEDLTMQMNGVTEASNTGDLATQVFVGGIGGILHENPKDALVIGLGSGITAAATIRHPGIESVECVEISEAVVHAARWFDDSNGHLLDDPRFHMIVGDGRNHLRLSGRQYDVIVSQPSNVWNSGIGSLMCSEFFAMASNQLRDGGILVSWIQGYSLSSDALRSVLAAARESFPTVSLWMGGWGDLVIIAGDQDFAVDVARLLEKGRDPAIGKMLSEMDAPDVLALLSKNLIAADSMDRFVGDFPPNTDDNLYLEFQAPKFLYRETIPELFDAINRASGGTEQILVNAPAGLVSSIPRVRQAMILENEARVAFRGNRGDEGLRAIEEAHRLHPTSRTIANIYSQALNGRGESLERNGEHAQAVRSYLQAAEIDPRHGAPFANLSKLYGESGQLPTALEASAEALKRNPQQPDFLGERAGLLVRVRRFDEAVSKAREALALDRRNRAALRALGAALGRLGRTAEADSVWTAAIQLRPEDAEEFERRRREQAK